MRALLGSLMYVAMATRPDLCYVVCVLSRYQSCASTLLFKLLLNILRYVKGTLNLRLKFSSDCNGVTGFVDSDWGGDVDRKSTSGCCFQVFGCTSIWFTRKQHSVALSSTEAEFVALSQAVSESCWLKDILKEFGFDVEPITLFEDNQSTIKLANMATCTSRVKHLEIKQSFVKEKLDKKVVSLVYVSTSDQVADVFTKALGGNLFVKFRNALFHS